MNVIEICPSKTHQFLVEKHARLDIADANGKMALAYAKGDVVGFNRRREVKKVNA